MSQAAILNHITGRIRVDVEFLVTEGLMSRYQADQLFSKLPQDTDSETETQPRQLASPPPSTATPQYDRPAQSFRKNNVPIPISLPTPASSPTRIVPQARALWGYNEDDSEPNDLSFPPDAIIDIVEETNSDWWKGRFNGREGLFPSTYVEKIARSPNARAAPSDSVKSALPSNHAKFVPPPAPTTNFNGPPPQNQWGAPPPQSEDGSRPPEQKKSKFGRFGRQAGDAAASGVGFGAGAAIGSGIVNAIF